MLLFSTVVLIVSLQHAALAAPAAPSLNLLHRRQHKALVRRDDVVFERAFSDVPSVPIPEGDDDDD